jgi:Holliday junction resolvase-like predicted endonuclease
MWLDIIQQYKILNKIIIIKIFSFPVHKDIIMIVEVKVIGEHFFVQPSDSFKGELTKRIENAYTFFNPLEHSSFQQYLIQLGWVAVEVSQCDLTKN